MRAEEKSRGELLSLASGPTQASSFAFSLGASHVSAPQEAAAPHVLYPLHEGGDESAVQLM